MNYVVTLKFAEPTYATQGQRVFSVTINGQSFPSLTNIDVAKAAGGIDKPLDIVVPVTVTNNHIQLAFSSSGGPAILNAIEIAATGQVYLSPSSAVVWPGQSQQFFGVAADATNPAVTSSISPNFGTVTAGFYTAPTSVA